MNIFFLFFRYFFSQYNAREASVLVTTITKYFIYVLQKYIDSTYKTLIVTYTVHRITITMSFGLNVVQIISST